MCEERKWKKDIHIQLANMKYTDSCIEILQNSDLGRAGKRETFDAGVGSYESCDSGWVSDCECIPPAGKRDGCVCNGKEKGEQA